MGVYRAALAIKGMEHSCGGLQGVSRATLAIKGMEHPCGGLRVCSSNQHLSGVLGVGVWGCTGSQVLGTPLWMSRGQSRAWTTLSGRVGMERHHLQKPLFLKHC